MKETNLLIDSVHLWNRVGCSPAGVELYTCTCNRRLLRSRPELELHFRESDFYARQNKS